ncbi:MAG: type II secretion system F family protein [Planctomycetota bacterium]|jgi:general secretion pathway protein F
METFSYQAISTANRLIEGLKDAPSQAQLVEELKGQGYVVLKVKKAGRKRRGIPRRAPHKILYLFTRELATLLEGGIPIDKSVRLLMNTQQNKAIKNILEDILNSLKAGRTLAQALSDYPKIFSPVHISMIQAGEEGGVLPDVLQKLNEYQERIERVKGAVVSAMIYPLVLLFTGTLSIIIIVAYVVPSFTEIFASMDMPTPLPIYVLGGMSTIISSYGWAVLLGFLLLSLLYLQMLRRNRLIRKKMDRIKLKLPYVGKVFWEIETSRFARTLGTLLENGVPLIRSLDLVQNTLTNSYLSECVETTKMEVRRGVSLTASLGKKGFLPEHNMAIVAAGEETGCMDKMFLKVADNQERELEERIRRIITLLEPLLILFMGLVIGIIVVSLLSSIFSLTETI